MTSVCPETGGPHNLSCDDKPTRCVDCGAKQDPEDIRIRSLSHDGKLRVVAPDARQSNGRVYVNDRLIIEAQTKDSLGNVGWRQVGDILVKPREQLDPQGYAIWVLLAGASR